MKIDDNFFWFKMDKNVNNVGNPNSEGDDDTMSSVYNAWRKISLVRIFFQEIIKLVNFD